MIKNMKIEPKTLKGFRDFLPKEAKKRQYTINILRSVFESYGFEPLETPALEYEEILAGKYGEEGDQLMYKFVDRGGRKVALRYDQTVPLARAIAQYGGQLTMPFKRYQIQPVWRAENPQKGRYRELTQCDIDIAGVDSALSDAETIAVAIEGYKKLGFKNFKVLINDRNIFSEFLNIIKEEDLTFVIRTIDKIKKIGKEKVLNEFIKKGFSTERATFILQTTENIKPTERLNQIFANLKNSGIDSQYYKFEPILARGMDYYTGLILEVEIEEYTAGSVGGGGRYDNLIGMFMDRKIPAVGFSFGLERIIDAMEEQNLFPDNLAITKVLVTIFSPELKEKSIEFYTQLRLNNINCELYLDENAKMDKQMRYANQKQIPYVLIIGPEEVEKNMATVRNMGSREQKTVPTDKIVENLK